MLTLRNVLLQPWDLSVKYALTRDFSILGGKFSEHFYDLTSVQQDQVRAYGLHAGLKPMRDPRSSGSLLRVASLSDLEDLVAWRLYDPVSGDKWYSSGLGYAIQPSALVAGTPVGDNWYPDNSGSFDPKGTDLTKFPNYWMFRGAIHGLTEAWWDLQRIAVIDRIMCLLFNDVGTGYGPWDNAQWPVDYPSGNWNPELVCFGGILSFLEDVSQRVIYDTQDYSLYDNSFGRLPYGSGSNWGVDPPYQRYEKVCCVRNHGTCPYYDAGSGSCLEDTLVYSPVLGRYKKFNWQLNRCKSKIWNQNDPNGYWTGCTSGQGVTSTSAYYTIGTGHSYLKFEDALRTLIRVLKLGMTAKGALGVGGSVEVSPLVSL